MMTLYKLFQRTEEEGTLSNSFLEASITLVPNPIEILQEKQIPICLHGYMCKNSTKKISKLSPTIYKKNSDHDQVVLTFEKKQSKSTY